jgi:hypothetical protein
VSTRGNKTIICATQYKDQPARTLASSRLAAQFLPGVGAKLCSLLYKPQDFELLVQRPDPAYRVAPYAGNYVTEGECSGLDDMFPTIDACYYERYPWAGAPLPDHGEVWTLPWDCEAEEGEDGPALHFTTYGVRLPYRLEKWASIRDEIMLHLAYRLTNLAAFDMDFLWAAHPMFVAEEGAELRLPAGIAKVVTAFSMTGSLGKHGDEYDWPVAALPDGRKRDLRKLRPKSTCESDKYYIKGPMPEGWCCLTYPQSRLLLRLAFPVETVPYLSILPDEGAWQDMYMIFIEPATAAFDRPDVARLRGMGSVVQARATYEWHLDISVGPLDGK